MITEYHAQKYMIEQSSYQQNAKISGWWNINANNDLLWKDFICLLLYYFSLISSPFSSVARDFREIWFELRKFWQEPVESQHNVAILNLEGPGNLWAAPVMLLFISRECIASSQWPQDVNTNPLLALYLKARIKIRMIFLNHSYTKLHC